MLPDITEVREGRDCVETTVTVKGAAMARGLMDPGGGWHAEPRWLITLHPTFASDQVLACSYPVDDGLVVSTRLRRL